MIGSKARLGMTLGLVLAVGPAVLAAAVNCYFATHPNTPTGAYVWNNSCVYTPAIVEGRCWDVNPDEPDGKTQCDGTHKTTLHWPLYVVPPGAQNYDPCVQASPPQTIDSPNHIDPTLSGSTCKYKEEAVPPEPPTTP